MTGIAAATACGDDAGENGGDGDGGEPSTGGEQSGGTAGTGTGGSNVGGESGDGGTATGGGAGTASGTGGKSGGAGDAGDGGEGANGGGGGAAGSSAGMGGGGAGGASGGMAGAGMAGSGMAGGGMAGGGMAGGGMAGGGMAGSSGAGGSGVIGCGTPSTFDDMEDGDGGICRSSNRVGGWYVEKETGVGSILPDVGTVVNPILLVPQRGTSTRGMHFQGSGFGGADHWALIAASVFAGTEGVPYDASVHTGIRFWAKSDAGGVVLNVKFKAVSTGHASNGGSCVPTTVPCEDHWQVPRTLSGAWQQFTVNFQTDLSQLGWGVPRPKDLAHLRGIEFFYNSNGNPTAFDFWIDDIEFW